MSQGNWILNKLKSSLLLFVIVACGSPKQPLPVYGQKQINSQGEEIDYTVSNFNLLLLEIFFISLNCGIVESEIT